MREEYIKHVRTMLAKEARGVGLEASVTGRRSTSSRSTRDAEPESCSTTRSTTWSRSASFVDSARECYEGPAWCTRTGAGARPLPRLLRDEPKGQHVPVPPHDGDRAVRRAHGGADRTPEMHRVRRGGRRGALALQGTERAGGPEEIRALFAWLRQILDLAAAPWRTPESCAR